MSTIISLSSCWCNKFFITVMSRNYEPYSSGIPFWASVAAPKFLLDAANIWLFFCAAYCVRLKEKTGFQSFFTGFMICLLIVVTSHVLLNSCAWYNLLLIIFPFVFPCLGLEVGCPWCSCFMPRLYLCPRYLGMFLWGKLIYLFDDFC